MFCKFGFINKLRCRKNRRGRRVHGERVEDIVLRLACIRELRNQAEGNLFYFRACNSSRTGFEKKSEIMNLMENVRRAECICEFLQKKEMQERRKLRHTAPLFTVYFEREWQRYMREYNIAYDEEDEVYYPIPRFLDMREEELQLELGEFDDVSSAAMALMRKKTERLRFRVFNKEDGE